MDRTFPASDFRQTLDATERLGNDVAVRTYEPLARAIESLRQILRDVDFSSGRIPAAGPIARNLRSALAEITTAARVAAPEIRDRVAQLLGTGGGLARKLAEIAPSLEIPSKPLFGVLPVARVIPMDVHSVADYANGITCLTTALFADSAEARFAAAALGASVISVSAMTDYRLSLADVIPIEVHEAIDYVWGAACILSPFVLGYYKKDPVAAAVHIFTGVATIGLSLITDYRAARGVGRSDVEQATLAGTITQPGLRSHPQTGSDFRGTASSPGFGGNGGKGGYGQS